MRFDSTTVTQVGKKAMVGEERVEELLEEGEETESDEEAAADVLAVPGRMYLEAFVIDGG